MAINRNLSILAQGASSTGNLLNYTGANKIINGDMAIDQRNAGASVTPTVNPTYTLDRWTTVFSAASKFSVQQNAGSVAVLAGMPKNYAGITSLSSYSLSSSDYFFLTQYIEGLNCADLNFGSSIASDITLSFWVRSSLTGTFGGVLQNSAQDRTYCFSYSIASANTWTKISVTIPGDQSGTWLTTNGIGLRVFFTLGTGSTFKGTPAGWSATAIFAPTGAVDIVATNSATWYVTGVKIEVGTVATPFVPDDYAVSLQKCFRYYEKQIWNSGNYAFFGYTYSGSAGYAMIQYTSKRSNPAITIPLAAITNTAGTLIMANASFGNTTGAGTFNPVNATPGLDRCRVDMSGFTGFTTNGPCSAYVATAGSPAQAIFAADAEL
jgi:hypothetical protein